MYQLRVDRTIEGTRQLWYRTITCGCSKCVIGDYDNCVGASGVDGSGWKLVDLTPMTKEEARHQRMLAKLTKEVYDEKFRLQLKPKILLKFEFNVNLITHAELNVFTIFNLRKRR